MKVDSYSEYSYKLEVSDTIKISDLLYWCYAFDSIGTFSYRAGTMRVIIDPSTFMPIMPGPHLFQFELEKDAAVFALKWC